VEKLITGVLVRSILMRAPTRAGSSRWRICDITWQNIGSQKHLARLSLRSVNIRRPLPGRTPPRATSLLNSPVILALVTAIRRVLPAWTGRAGARLDIVGAVVATAAHDRQRRLHYLNFLCGIMISTFGMGLVFLPPW
jgi:hypothetical protein